MRKHMLWSEEYRPSTIRDCILPKPLKTTLQNYVNKKEVPNLWLFSNKPGSGKTSTVKALMNELGYDHLS